MTNKPMLSVACDFCGSRNEIKAASWVCVIRVEGECFVCKRPIVWAADDKPSAQHQGEPVAWATELGLKGIADAAKTTWPSFVSVSSHKSNHDGISVALYRERPAPVADHTQCEECKGWGYHENHHEGGGTACGECDGSGNAPVSVVMPEPYSLAMFQMISGFESVTPEQFDLVWSACRSEVARLNGVKK